MKVLISTDIEGIAGVFHAEQTRAGNGEYVRFRQPALTTNADRAVIYPTVAWSRRGNAVSMK